MNRVVFLCLALCYLSCSAAIGDTQPYLSLSKAAQALSEHRFPSTISILNNVLQQEIDKKEKACALWLRTKAYRELGHFREASLDLGSIESLHLVQFSCEGEKVDMKSIKSLKALTYCDKSEFEFARAAYDKLVIEFPRDVGLMLDRVNCLLRAQDWRDALNLLEAMSEEDIKKAGLDYTFLRVEGLLGNAKSNAAFSTLNELKDTDLYAKTKVLIRRNLVLTAKTMSKHFLNDLHPAEFETTSFYVAKLNALWFFKVLEKHHDQFGVIASHALSSAVIFNRPDMLKWLLEKGANPNYEDQGSIQLAQEVGRKEMTSLLKDFAAKLPKVVESSDTSTVKSLARPKNKKTCVRNVCVKVVSAISALLVLFLLIGIPRDARIQTAQDDLPVAIDSYTRETILSSYTHMIKRSQQVALQEQIPTPEICPEDKAEGEPCRHMTSYDLVYRFMIPAFQREADKIFLATFFSGIMTEDTLLLDDSLRKEVRKVPELPDAGLYLAIRFGKKKAQEWIMESGFRFNPVSFSQLVKTYRIFTHIPE